MSIQRYDYSGVLANIDVNEWVSYEDHVAEVERVRQETRNEVFDGHHRYYQQVREDAISACIAAVEALRDTWGDVVVLDGALAGLREVQP